MSRLLLDESPLVVLPSLACAVGLNEAIILQQVHYWLAASKTEINGHRWVYNTVKQWADQFPFFSEQTIARALKSLRDRGVLVAEKLAEDRFDKTLFYRIDYAVFDSFDTIKMIASEVSNCQSLLITETTTENTNTRAREKTRKTEVTFAEYRAKVEDLDQAIIAEDDPIYTTAEQMGLPDDYIAIAWTAFTAKYVTSDKKYKDWRAVFRNAVREDWLHLWAINRDGDYFLTPAGKMIEKAMHHGN
jgi:hypothetical protein